jgi:hypothetical protein
MSIVAPVGATLSRRADGQRIIWRMTPSGGLEFGGAWCSGWADCCSCCQRLKRFSWYAMGRL